jgi:hypothetical protein
MTTKPSVGEAKLVLALILEAVTIKHGADNRYVPGPEDIKRLTRQQRKKHNNNSYYKGFTYELELPSRKNVNYVISYKIG